MKNFILKIEDKIFHETERILSNIKKSRNQYINDAVEFYNYFQNRKLLAAQLKIESKIVREESMKILAEFEKMGYEN